MRILLLAQGWANCDRRAGGLSIVTPTNVAAVAASYRRISLRPLLYGKRYLDTVSIFLVVVVVVVVVVVAASLSASPATVWLRHVE